MIKLTLEELVLRDFDLGEIPGRFLIEYVKEGACHDYHSDYPTEKPVVFIWNPVEFDRFIQTEAGQKYKADLNNWYIRWSQAMHVSHMVVSYNERDKDVGFLIVFKDKRTMNGGHINHDGNWSSHT